MPDEIEQIAARNTPKLSKLLDRFLEENAKLNLSALRTPEACMIGNIHDSLALELWEGAKNSNRSVMDVGTGGGFPLLPIAILHPDWECTGMDAIRKKLMQSVALPRTVTYRTFN